MATRIIAARSTPVTAKVEKHGVGKLVPVALLVAAGSLTGLSTDLAKVAFEANISPYAFLTWSVVGAAMALTGAAVVQGRRPTFNASTGSYFLGAAVLTVVLPRLLMFSAVPNVGVSFVAVSIAFPPLYTYGFALVLRLEPFAIGRATGIGLALAGSLLIALLKLSEPNASVLWVGLALVAPLFLALGNIYRTLRWPYGLAPDELAPGMVSVAALILLAAAILPGFSLDVSPNGPALFLIAVHAAILTALYLVMFELQQRGGPVLLSLMGSIAAVVGSGIAVAALDEAVPRGLLPGGLAIAAGIGLVSRQPEPDPISEVPEPGPLAGGSSSRSESAGDSHRRNDKGEVS